MIELRWHVSFSESKCPESVICGGDIVGKPIKRVLQYRQVELRVDASGALTPLPNVTWTDWQDVPTVSEE
jgi:hypothetical protein